MNIGQTVRACNTRRRSPIDVGQMYLVVRGLGQQAGNQRADLAGPQNQHLTHAMPPKKGVHVSIGACVPPTAIPGIRRAGSRARPRSSPSTRTPRPSARSWRELARLPPIVVSWEVENLRERLAAVQRGEGFLLQGGDCAESFVECESDRIAKQLKVLLQMSLVLLSGMKKPVIRVGRMAGQYAKPRSADMETRDGVTLPAYRGDLVNRPEFTPEARRADPQLLLRGYERAALTLNFVRALVDGGFADLHHPEYWDLGFVRHAQLREAYERIARSIGDALDFFESLSGKRVHEATRVDFFASHEGLHLLYEQAQTRYIARQNRWYNLSTHMPWIGMRTAAARGRARRVFPRHRQSDRHQDRRGHERAVAAGTGDHAQSAESARAADADPPLRRQGHREVAAGGDRGGASAPATRCCGAAIPMHGNTETSTGGFKTRRFENILKELDLAFRIHADQGSYLGGAHIELTGEDVTECTGGARGLTDADLQRAYRSQVDPRLNYEQALELAMLIAERSKRVSLEASRAH